MRRALLLFLFPLLAGCIHRVSEDDVLRELGEGAGPGGVAGEAAPAYIAFANEQSERAFGSLAKSGLYRMTSDRSLLCPYAVDSGPKGYVLSARVVTMNRNRAVATLSSSCRQFIPKCAAGDRCLTMGGEFVKYEITYFLVRKNGKWRVETAQGAITAM
ncbi:MAG: hypothetical protein ACREMS_07275 [Gemmatimonadaceae bacterium]